MSLVSSVPMVRGIQMTGTYEPPELPGMSSLNRTIRGSLALGQQYRNKSCFKRRTMLCMVLSEYILVVR